MVIDTVVEDRVSSKVVVDVRRDASVGERKEVACSAGSERVLVVV